MALIGNLLTSRFKHLSFKMIGGESCGSCVLTQNSKCLANSISMQFGGFLFPNIIELILKLSIPITNPHASLSGGLFGNDLEFNHRAM